MPAELTSLLTFVLDLLRDYGLDDFFLELSTRDDSDKFIGSVERGERNLSILNLRLIARTLRVSLADLLNGLT